jgi:hypothetical protein
MDKEEEGNQSKQQVGVTDKILSIAKEKQTRYKAHDNILSNYHIIYQTRPSMSTWEEDRPSTAGV